MKILGNCRIIIEGDCPFLRLPMYHSGFTGKSGEETWWFCTYHKKYIRNIKNCDLKGDHDKQVYWGHKIEKEILNFGKYKGKTIKEIVDIEEDYGYIVWLNDNVSEIDVGKPIYNYCKKMIEEDSAIYDSIMDSDHGDWGNRD